MEPDRRVFDDCNCAALKRATRRLTNLYDRELSEVRLTSGQFSILGTLNRFSDQPPTQTELAKLHVIEKSALARALKPMIREKLIALADHPTDGRIRLVVITAKGRQVLASATSAWKRAEMKFTDAFGEDDAAALRVMLTRVEAIEIGAM